jgi:pimeloyl-ACP methyl ester carboxylesterase
MRILTAVAVLTVATQAAAQIPATPAASAKGKYAAVNGLKMYYEIHGQGKPLVLLHGAFGTVEGWGPYLPALAKNRQLIMVEMQGHGRTADIDRPLDYRLMAKDTVALLKHLGIGRADLFGYSMGGGIALEIAAKHPEVVDKLAIIGAGSGSIKDTYDPEVYKQFKSITPENFNYPDVKDPYTKVAPEPAKWPILVSKIMKMEETSGMADADVKKIKAPTLIMLGDRDAVRVEHAAEMYRMIPNCQLAIFPSADHFLPFTATDKVLATLSAFLDAPVAAKEG